MAEVTVITINLFTKAIFTTGMRVSTVRSLFVARTEWRHIQNKTLLIR